MTINLFRKSIGQQKCLTLEKIPVKMRTENYWILINSNLHFSPHHLKIILDMSATFSACCPSHSCHHLCYTYPTELHNCVTAWLLPTNGSIPNLQVKLEMKSFNGSFLLAHYWVHTHTLTATAVSAFLTCASWYTLLYKRCSTFNRCCAYLKIHTIFPNHLQVQKHRGGEWKC